MTYRICGLLSEPNRLLDKRRELRGRTMDALHDDDIEIVSPTFMNTRSLRKDQLFLSKVARPAAGDDTRRRPDALVFDKAEKAESVEKLRATLIDLQERQKACNELLSEANDAQAIEAAEAEIAEIDQRIERVIALIDRKEAKIAKD